MNIQLGELFTFVLSFTGTDKQAVTIPLEVAWVKAWTFGDTVLFKLERYKTHQDGTREVVQTYFKTEGEIRKGLMDSDKELDITEYDFS